jgi:hypothetical protein
VGELLPKESHELAEGPDGHVLGLHHAVWGSSMVNTTRW